MDFLEFCYPFERTSNLTFLAKGISFFGDGYVAPILFTLVIAVLIGARDRKMGTLFIFSALGGNLLKMAIKQALQKPRPVFSGCEALASPGEYSFPSGHAVFYTIISGFMIWYGIKYLKGWKRWLLATVAVLIILAVSFSRVYLGVHFLSDVLAGVAIGTIIVIIATAIYKLLKEKDD